MTRRFCTVGFVFCLFLSAQIDLSCDDMTKEEYKEEIEYLGIEYSLDNFFEAAKRGVVDVLDLFLKAGIEEEKEAQEIALLEHALFHASYRGQNEAVVFLVQNGAEVSGKGATESSTPLFKAASMGHADVVRTLIDYGADVDFKDEEVSAWYRYTNSPLMTASLNGYIDVMKALIDGAVDVNAAGKYGETALMKTALGGHILSMSLEPQVHVNLTFTHMHGEYESEEIHTEAARLLLEAGANPNQQDMGGHTALMWAAYRGRPVLSELLINAGADVHARNGNGMSALQWAASDYLGTEGHRQTSRLLMKGGAEMDLHFISAAKIGLTDIVESQLALGADIDEQDNEGNTALMLASESGFTDTVNALMRGGARLDLKNANEETAVVLAAICRRDEVVETLKRAGAVIDKKGYEKILQRLYQARFAVDDFHGQAAKGNLEAVALFLEAGMDVNSRGGWSDSMTALLEAAKRGQHEMIRFLIENGADVNASDEYEGSALLQSVKKYDIETAVLLIASGADLDAKDSNGVTALIYSIVNNIHEMVELLIEKGADIDAKGNDGSTALMCATIAGKSDIVEMLIRKGADVNAENNFGETALDYAKQRYYLSDIVEMLKEAGAQERTGR